MSELLPQYPIVVVGSGYGGGIAASRLARAGREVCVLERGRELRPGDFPRTELEATAHTQVQLGARRIGDPLALMDFHVDGEINVLRGCGLGGTSLINANVALEADPRVFDDPRWPPELRADVGTRLRDGYRRACEVLDPKPYPAHWPRLEKLEALADSAASMGEKVVRLPLNVVFEDRVNPFGVAQRQCTSCGDCVSGCNEGSKTTVAATYLADAWNHGASIFTEVAVDRVLPSPDGRWAVYYDLVGSGRDRFERDAQLVVLADIVILAAGSLGSTEILLRSRAAGLKTSERLGHGFSGNADVLGFTYDASRRINGVGVGTADPAQRPAVGPTITSAIDGRTAERPLSEHFLIQDGALPATIAAIYPMGFRMAADAWGTDTRVGLLDGLVVDGAGGLAQNTMPGAVQNAMPDGVQVAAVARTQTMLGMGHDSASGRLRLADNGRLRIDWPGAEREPIIDAINDTMLACSSAIGGTFLPNPLWTNRFESSLITVHPLGGCAMGADATDGVTDHRGRVFSGEAGAAVHEGLYVTDGAVIPTSLGANPLLTISAVAERNIALLAEERGWTIPYALDHRPTGPVRPPPAGGIGVRFTERMSGHVALVSGADRADHRAAYDAGRAAGTRLSFVLTLTSDDLDATLRHPDRPMHLEGTVDAPALSSEPLQVSEGRFSLLSADPEQHDTTNMIYEMTLTSTGGRRWYFRGVKYVHDDPGFDLWSDTTTLFVDLRDESGTMLRGLLHIGLRDFLRQLATIDVVGARSKSERLQAVAKFGRFFTRSLADTYAEGLVGPSVFDAEAPARERRLLRVDPPEVHYFFTSDGVQLCLTRYRGGDKGPVILCHGLGVSSRIFTVDTIETNLVEYLVAHGYDVWLLDYRASIELAASAQPSDGDTIAAIDYPESVAEVRRLTGADTVQMVVHCFGSTVFFMSMLGGKLTGVRSVVASQAVAHVEAAGLVRLKSGLRVPAMLRALGVDAMTAHTDEDTPWHGRLFDRLLRLHPVEANERCASAACRRISFLYSLLYEHEQLTVATHDTLHELFGVANMRAFEHLAQMVRSKRLVNARGEDVYLPHPERLAIPLRIIHGAENACFHPSGSERTLGWLCSHNDPSLYSRVVIPRFGHIDCIFGRRAAAEVFPHILEHLEAHA